MTFPWTGIKCLPPKPRWFGAVALGCMLAGGAAAADWSCGPMYDEFALTLGAGTRREAAGPFWYAEDKGTQHQYAVPPLFSRTVDPGLEMTEMDVLYPLASYDRFGEEYRWHVFQWLSLAGGQNQASTKPRRFSVFPFYFNQRSVDTNLNYTAWFPFYGDLKNRFFRDEIHFVLFPAYGRSVKKGVVTENYLYPFVHRRAGPALEGWQVWPLYGLERKSLTWRTNTLDEAVADGGHEKRFVCWPFFLDQVTGIGTTNRLHQQALVPLYSCQRSAQRCSTSYGWPIGLTLTTDREKQYEEVGAPWPLVVFAHGPGKTCHRVWPFYSRASNSNHVNGFYLWPLYKYNRILSEPLARERQRVLLFLYSDAVEKNTVTGDFKRRTDLWPLATAWRDLEGNERVQFLSILEPILPNNKSIERNWSPLWSLWRAEKNARTGAASRSFLWNLYRHDRTAESEKTSWCFGLVQRERVEGRWQWRLLHWKTRAEKMSKPAAAPAP